MHDLIARLESQGYLVLVCVPGQVFEVVAFPNAFTNRLGPGWLACASRTSGFTDEEASAIAHDREGALYHLRDDDVL